MKTICSIREISRRENVSHSAIIQSIREGRPCDGIDYGAAAVQSPEGTLKGVILEDLEESRLLPHVEETGCSSDNTKGLQLSEHNGWPWAATVDDVIQGKPVLGNVYQVGFGEVVKHFASFSAIKRQNMYSLISEKIYNKYASTTLDLVIDTIDRKGDPFTLMCRAEIGNGAVQLSMTERKGGEIRIPV
jgi:hypothetical protein